MTAHTFKRPPPFRRQRQGVLCKFKANLIFSEFQDSQCYVPFQKTKQKSEIYDNIYRKKYVKRRNDVIYSFLLPSRCSFPLLVTNFLCIFRIVKWQLWLSLTLFCFVRVCARACARVSLHHMHAYCSQRPRASSRFTSVVDAGKILTKVSGKPNSNMSVGGVAADQTRVLFYLWVLSLANSTVEATGFAPPTYSLDNSNWSLFLWPSQNNLIWCDKSMLCSCQWIKRLITHLSVRMNL